MPSVTLTARFVASVKPNPGKRTEYCDDEVPGLALRVMPTGAKSWTVRYWHGQHQRRMTLGTLAVVPLAKARELARDLLYAAGKGSDPATEKQAGRKAETIADLAELYIEKWAKPRKRSWKADDNLLRNKVLPKWRHRRIKEITRHDVRLLVESVAEAGAPIVANRVAALLSKMFSFGLDRDLVQASPAVRIPRPGAEHARDRVLSHDELRTLWRECDSLDVTMAAFFKLRLLTAQRGGEVSSMRWADVDLDAGWWTVPATISKNKLAHRVPLNASAVAILKQLRAECDRILAARAARGDVTSAPIEYVLNGARGKRQQAEAAANISVADFRGHDLRRTAASYMASGGIPRLTIGKLLNHAERGVTAVYDRHSYDAEKRAAVSWWDRELRRVLQGSKKPAAVVNFRHAARGTDALRSENRIASQL